MSVVTWGVRFAAKLGTASRGILCHPRHQKPNLPLVRVLALQLARDPAVEHDQDAVGEGEDLVELDRDEEDGLARIAHGDEAPVDELDGADVDAAGGLADE